MFKDKEAILFDLDGTLIDSAPDLAIALNHTLATLEQKTFHHDTIRSWVGNGAQTLVKRGLSGSTEINKAIDPEFVGKALDIFLDYYSKNLCVTTVTYPNVLQTLHSLKSMGYRLVLVTNKPYDFIEPLLEGLGMKGLFELCLGGDSLERRKPDPLPLLHVCESLDICASKCIMIGDSKNDILAANSANMQSIGVSYGYNYDEDISAYKPDTVVHDFDEIIDLLSISR